jgi:hypothetical protein
VVVVLLREKSEILCKYSHCRGIGGYTVRSVVVTGVHG